MATETRIDWEEISLHLKNWEDQPNLTTKGDRMFWTVFHIAATGLTAGTWLIGLTAYWAYDFIKYLDHYDVEVTKEVEIPEKKVKKETEEPSTQPEEETEFKTASEILENEEQKKEAEETLKKILSDRHRAIREVIENADSMARDDIEKAIDEIPREYLKQSITVEEVRENWEKQTAE